MSMLAKICADKLEHIKRQKSIISLVEIEEKAANSGPCRNFANALLMKAQNKQNALIAEIKKASPSKGVIRENFDPANIAALYEKGGATCISVLTDEPYFGGKDENLLLTRNASKLPILRKDFMLDSYQVFEARALGADCILLIMAALSDTQAKELEDIAFSLGIDVLLEVHDEDELVRALQLKSKLIGINNRSLVTLKVDLDNTARLAPEIPTGYTMVCESGINTHSDIMQINKLGVYSFLVGESLMREDDIESATRKLLLSSSV
jgi:indole-3-glycerol phosphate synthase